MIKGFTKQNWKDWLVGHPVEDAYSFDEQKSILAVADGVTRDPSDILPNIRTLSGKIKFALNYPKQSPARVVSQIFSSFLPWVLRDYDIKDEKALRDSFAEVNKMIASWNARNLPGGRTDYLTNDFAGCVAAAAVLDKDVAHWAYIADCGIAVVDGAGKLRYKTPDDGPGFHDEFFSESHELKNKKWEQPKTREIVRSVFRNNPSREHSYGVLTGEQSALSYIKTGTSPVAPGDMLLVYTDGAGDCLFDVKYESNKDEKTGKKIKVVKSESLKQEPAGRIAVKDFGGLEAHCKTQVNHEGTLVYYI